MKASRQFQKQPASSATPISQTSKRLQTRPFRDPNAPTTAQASQSSLPAADYDPSDRPAWWDRLTFNPQRPSTVQAKLTVGAPNDVYEQEADRVADQVMSMPDSATQQPLQREAMPEEELQTKPLAAAITPLVQREAMPEEEEPVQAKASGSADIQREEMAEEEEVQTKLLASGTLQREEMAPEEEELQMKSLGTADLQREEIPEEEDALQTKSLGTADLQREALPEEDSLQTKSSPTPHTPHPTPSLETQLSNTQGSGSPLPDDVRSFMEPRFGADFSQVRVHTGSDAVQMNRDLNAQAFTHKQDVYFGAGKTPGNNALTAHELTHVVQQTSGVQTKLTQNRPDIQQKCSACEAEDTTVRRKEDSNAQVIQRKIGDGHDLTSPRFAGDPVLEACFDNEHRMLFSETGSAVEKVQQALTDSGLPLKIDGIFGAKTQAAVAKFKRDNGITPSDGVVGPQTMAELDQRFQVTPFTPPGQLPMCPSREQLNTRGGELPDDSLSSNAKSLFTPIPGVTCQIKPPKPQTKTRKVERIDVIDSSSGSITGFPKILCGADLNNPGKFNETVGLGRVSNVHQFLFHLNQDFSDSVLLIRTINRRAKAGGQEAPPKIGNDGPGDQFVLRPNTKSIVVGDAPGYCGPKASNNSDPSTAFPVSYNATFKLVAIDTNSLKTIAQVEYSIDIEKNNLAQKNPKNQLQVTKKIP